MSRPLYMEDKPTGPIRAARGAQLRCKTWEAEAALRMLENNLDPDVALVPDELIVYGGSGRAARNWRAFRAIVQALTNLEPDETLLVQSGKPVGVLKTHADAPRVLLANSNLVPKWSTQEEFDRLDQLGLTMYGQMTAGSWIYIATQGILQGTYETFAALAAKHFGGNLRGRFVLTGGLGGMSGAQPLAVTMNEGVILAVEVFEERVRRKVKENYCDRMTHSLEEALAWVREARESRAPLSVGLVANIATVAAELAERGITPDVVTDQTSAHDLMYYYPEGDLAANLRLREENPEGFRRQALGAIRKHVRAILAMRERGGVGIGNSTHAGMVIVATGTREKELRLERVLTCDPGTGIFRHVDAGYEEAGEVARRCGVKVP